MAVVIAKWCPECDFRNNPNRPECRRCGEGLSDVESERREV